MKKILGLDIGTTSIGWAYVYEAENNNEKSLIKKLGVRIIPISTDEENDFQKGKSITINADRTLKRSMRRNLQRYKLRRNALITILKEQGLIDADTVLAENNNNSTFETYRLRAEAAKKRIAKEEFARVLLMINKKRGYKSSRKAKNEEEGSLINGMDVAKQLYEEGLTPGQLVYNILMKGGKIIPEFYKSDLLNEFDKIWNFQKGFFPDLLTDDFYEQLKNKGKRATSQLFFAKYNVYTSENKGSRDEKRKQAYKWRSQAVNTRLSIEELAFVLTEINNNINSSSGYLGKISDYSKELYFNKETVGQYQYKQLVNNPHTRLKDQVFFRQDYLDEFEKIWEVQSKYYPVLTDELKTEIRDVIIFYQRRLKSQKHLISNCEFERYHKVIPKSSPLFQEFKIWQVINNIKMVNLEEIGDEALSQDQKNLLFRELQYVATAKKVKVLNILGLNPKKYDLNFKESIEGNRTNAAIFEAFQKILDIEGYLMDFEKMRAEDIYDEIHSVFSDIGIDTGLLRFDSTLVGENLFKQPAYMLWHLLYSFEDDNDKLYSKLQEKYGFKIIHAKIISNISLQQDHGNLSARAIRKILPFMRKGDRYDEACVKAGYNHSFSRTKEEQRSRELKDKLEVFPKNSLRNPVVEKILSQMSNLVNAIIDDNELGRPDEIRIELARELKKSAKERDEMTKGISRATKRHQEIRELLQTEFHINKVTRNDIIRYKLYEELAANGYKTLYMNKYIPQEKLFSKEFDIDHIIPQSRLFDDSFSNKTLAKREINIEKGNKTAYDYLVVKLSEEDFSQYLLRVKDMYKDRKLTKAKYQKLLMKESDIPDDFIERDLRNSQYISKMARQVLEEVVRDVTTTTGSITDRLRKDWQLIDVMKELNFSKYRELGLTETIEGKNGKMEERIIEWTKRNDHRHHAMDALTVAFTKLNHVQYLNNLNARSDKSSSIYGIEQKELYRDKNNRVLFKPPIPLDEFRSEAKKHLESLLVSFKAKNKVVTRNLNKTRKLGKDNYNKQISLTPRGQLHKETIYGRIRKYVTKEEKVGVRFNIDTVEKIAVKRYRKAILKRLIDNGYDPKKAFTGKNNPVKNPLFVDELHTEQLPEKVKLVWLEELYTIRKNIDPKLKIEKVIDKKIQRILKQRLKEYDNDPKKAFINLDRNPIWLNKDKGISIKRVTISGVSNAEPLHEKTDHLGKSVLDKNGNPIPVDFVSTGNNHHVAIYRDEKGNLHEEVVSFYEAVHRVNMGVPIINKEHFKGWQFLFSIKQNEYFVFPSDGFDPSEVDLLNPDNFSLISPNLFRVQKIATLNYFFRHHLETQLINRNETKEVTYYNIRSLLRLEGLIKVRLNHLGNIVEVGE